MGAGAGGEPCPTPATLCNRACWATKAHQPCMRHLAQLRPSHSCWALSSRSLLRCSRPHTTPAMAADDPSSRTIQLPNTMEAYKAGPDQRVFAPAAGRNKDPILATLSEFFVSASKLLRVVLKCSVRGQGTFRTHGLPTSFSTDCHHAPIDTAPIACALACSPKVPSLCWKWRPAPASTQRTLQPRFQAPASSLQTSHQSSSPPLLRMRWACPTSARPSC